MELVDGQTVANLARRGPVAPSAVIDLLVQAADALGAAHAQGIVHGDVKPANLLVSATGVVKITDFGIACAIGAMSLTDDGNVAGTARYMSPEQATGSAISPAADVYSLAVVGHQLLSGRSPFEGSAATLARAHVHSLPPPLPPRVPAALRAVLDRALAKDTGHRPADGAALAVELRAAADAITAGARSIRPAQATSVDADTTALDATAVWNVAQRPGAGAPSPPVALVGAAQLLADRTRRRWLVASIVVVVAAALVGVGARAATVQQPEGRLPTVSTVPTVPTVATPSATPVPAAEPTGATLGSPAPTSVAETTATTTAPVDITKKPGKGPKKKGGG